jgi:hypothetical protein
MKYVLGFWAVPMGLFWGWYFLSLNDMNFGYLVLSRQLHDFFFQLYGDMLGIDPKAIPPMVARACVLDTFLLMGIWAFRRRRELKAWWRARYTVEGRAEGSSGSV